jgi:uncharacterized membrane protein YphA (DoxX/SURF4 family)
LLLLILRLGSGALMLTHGWPKLMRLIEGGEITFPDPLGIGNVASLIFAMLAEFVGSIFRHAGNSNQDGFTGIDIYNGSCRFYSPC